MLPFGSKTLLQHQLEAFAANGLTEFHVVRGYRGDKIQYPGITYHDNLDFPNNNVLNSLFYAEPALSGSLIVSYSDILFDSKIVQELLKTECDISIVVDVDWRHYYAERIEHPIAEAEAVVMGDGLRATKIGKIAAKGEAVDGEFIGMMKLTSRGTEQLKSWFHAARKRFWGMPFERTAIFQNAYLTDMLQHMIDGGVAVHCVTIKRGWKEIDTVQDYKKALVALGIGTQ
jgi:choline kinase